MTKYVQTLPREEEEWMIYGDIPSPVMSAFVISAQKEKSASVVAIIVLSVLMSVLLFIFVKKMKQASSI